MFDTAKILGINRWIKPMKFAMSIWVYLWTVAVYLYFVPGREGTKKVIGYGPSCWKNSGPISGCCASRRRSRAPAAAQAGS